LIEKSNGKFPAQDRKDRKLFDSTKQKKTRPHGTKERKRILELEKKFKPVLSSKLIVRMGRSKTKSGREEREKTAHTGPKIRKVVPLIKRNKKSCQGIKYAECDEKDEK
jgi:hypothetical protein